MGRGRSGGAREAELVSQGDRGMKRLQGPLYTFYCLLRVMGKGTGFMIIWAFTPLDAARAYRRFTPQIAMGPGSYS